MTQAVNFNYEIWNVHNACDALWMSRGSEFTTAVLSAVLTSATPVDVAKRLHSNKTQGTMWLGVNEQNDIISCRWTKDTQSPAGVWSITLKPRMDYMTRLAPGDLVFIFMSDNRLYDMDLIFSGKLVTVGLIDRVSETIAVSESGADSTVVLVTGRDFGVVFQETSTVFDPSFAEVPQTLFSGQYLSSVMSKQTAASPLENVLSLLNLVYNSQASGSLMSALQWLLHNQGGNFPLIGMLDPVSFVQVPLFGYALPDVVALAQAGNVWTLLESYANRLVNEFFVDVRDFTREEQMFLARQSEITSSFLSPNDVVLQSAALGALSSSPVFRSASARGLRPGENPDSAPQVLGLVFRQTPYDTGAFQALPEREVWHTEVMETDFGKSAQEVFNFFRVRSPSISAEFTELMYGIVVNLNSISRFGLRRFEGESQYFFATRDAADSFTRGNEQTSGAFSSVFDYYVGLLSTWHAANELMLSGSITTRLRPDIRVGHRLRLRYTRDDYIDFYVQALNHNFEAQEGGSRSIFTVVRGVPSTAVGIEANLHWTTSGRSIPATMTSYGRFTAFGVDLESVSGQRIVSEQRVNPPASVEGEPQ